MLLPAWQEWRAAALKEEWVLKESEVECPEGLRRGSTDVMPTLPLSDHVAEPSGPDRR
jgi:hypothetical protein